MYHICGITYTVEQYTKSLNRKYYIKRVCCMNTSLRVYNVFYTIQHTLYHIGVLQRPKRFGPRGALLDTL